MRDSFDRVMAAKRRVRGMPDDVYDRDRPEPIWSGAADAVAFGGSIGLIFIIVIGLLSWIGWL